MAKLKHKLLDKIGLTTKDRLARATLVKERWHSLVRDVFARYYLKLREPFYAYLPPLPHRYTDEWETQIRDNLDDFMEVDLQSVAELLEVCGFGTDKWEQIKDLGFADLEQIVENHISGGNGHSPGIDLGTEDALNEARDEIRKLRIGGRRALGQIKEYESQISRLEQELTHAENAAPSGSEDEDEDDGPPRQLLADTDEETLRRIEELQQELEHSKQTVEELRQELEDRPAGGIDESADDGPSSRELEELEEKLEDRDRTIAELQAQVENLQNELEEAPASTDDSLLVDDDLAKQNAQLRGEIRGKDQTIDTLKEQIEELENSMDSARDQLMDQVKALGELTSGDIELKPSEELDDMGADELLDYAQDVASDLDVRKQTLDQGIQSVEEVKDNYEQSRSFYDVQQKKFQSQLEDMGAQLAAYSEQVQETGEVDENAPQVIAAQRHQLELLTSRITELSNSNKNLSLSHDKMYKDMELAVKKLIPLRRQIEELESLRDTITRYVREKHDRGFTIKKLASR
jgi:chromosome segregation ATPase